MAKLKINGVEIETRGRVLTMGDIQYDHEGGEILEIRIGNKGSVNIVTTGNVTITDTVKGDLTVTAPSVSVGVIQGSVKASGDVHCQTIKGSVTCGRDFIGGRRG